MATYTYLFADLRTGRIVDELPLSGVTFSRRLNDVGEFRGQLRVTDAEVRQRRPRVAATPGRTALYVDRDGTLVWGGILWASRYDGTSGTLELTGHDFFSYFEHRRLVRHPLSNTEPLSWQGDQLMIAREIVALAQSHPGGDLGIEVTGPEVSTVDRSVSYAAHELKPVAEALRELAEADRGFDFAMDTPYGPDGRPRRLLRLGFPQLGGRGAGHVWEYGANLLELVWPADAAAMATRVFVQGTGGEEDRIVVYAEDAAAGEQGWPLLEEAESFVDSSDLYLLAAQARARLAATRRPVVLPELVVRADLDPVLGSYAVGDEARIVVEDPFFADGALDVPVRVLGYEVEPGDDGGLERVTLTVAPVREAW